MPRRTADEQQRILWQIRDDLAAMRSEVYNRCGNFVDYAVTDEDHFLKNYPAGRSLSVKHRTISGPIVVSLKAAQVHFLSPLLISRGYVHPDQLDGFFRALQIEIGGDDLAAVLARWDDFIQMPPPQMVTTLQADMTQSILGHADEYMSGVMGHALHPITIPAEIILARAFDDREFVAELEAKLEDFRDQVMRPNP